MTAGNISGLFLKNRQFKKKSLPKSENDYNGRVSEQQFKPNLETHFDIYQYFKIKDDFNVVTLFHVYWRTL